MQDVFAYCRDLVRSVDRDRYLSALFAPADRRDALIALYAFDDEIARVRDVSREPMPGEIRLQWWREAIEGKRDGEAAANPVAAALLATIARYDLPRDALLDGIEARSFDLYDDPMPTLAALQGYSDKTRGAVLFLASKIVGEELPTDVAAAGGFLITVAEIVLNLPHHAARGRLFLPLESMQRHDVGPEDLLAGKSTGDLRQVVSELISYAGERWSDAQKSLPVIRSAALLPVAIARATLDRAASNENPLKPVALSALRRQWLLWRAARNPQRLL